MRVTIWHVGGVLASAALVGAAVVACHPGGVGYVEIKTVPVAALTQTALYLDSTKLDPIRQGNALLQQPAGTLMLQADSFGGTLVPICNVVVRRDRITTVTISVLERPPRCVCRFSSTGDASDRTCVS